MNLPKLKFRVMTLQENIDVIKWAYYENDGPLSVYNYTILCFPELSDLKKEATKEEVFRIIEKVVAERY